MALVWTVLAQSVCVQLISGAVVNVALRKPVDVSFREANRDPSIAVDGNTTAVDTCCVMHTALGRSTAWWWVDLQTQVQDATVKIYFRTDCCDNTYGVDCDKSCNSRQCAVTPVSCDRYTGACPAGRCEVGWLGIDCTQACSSGSYGSGCNLSCGDRNCRLSSTCDHVTGQCVGGCLSGWTGTDCKQACSSGSYGSGCNLSCGDRNCRLPSTCDHVTGQCVGGCLSGWTGTDCKQECLQGTNYGADCSKSCSARHCRTLPSACDPETGQCPNGCQDGWRGEDCTSPECPEGTFGVSCLSCRIRHCEGESDCPSDGTCSSGCQDGWLLSNCTQGVTVKTPSTLSTGTAGVIGAVIGAVLMFVLGGGIHLCLVRSGRLKWMNVRDHQEQSSEMMDITNAQLSRQAEHPNSDSIPSDYAVLDVQTVSNNKDYDVIKNRVYENS